MFDVLPGGERKAEMRCCCSCLCKVGNAVRLLHFLLTVFVLYVLTATETTGEG